MSGELTHAIYRGWKIAERESAVDILGAGRILDVNARVRVVSGTTPGAVLGDPFLAWAPMDTLSKCMKCVHPGENLTSWQSINRMGAEHMPTLGFFAQTEEQANLVQERLAFSFIASALRMMSVMRFDVGAQFKEALNDFFILAGVKRPNDIWGDDGWQTLPDAPTKEIMAMRCEALVVGFMARRWHDKIFKIKRMVEVWPIEAGTDEDAPFQSSIDRGAVIRPYISKQPTFCGKGGSQEWRDLTSDRLEKLVWMHPRQRLAKMFSVSDMAIIKRCRRDGISQPPRGFWQKIGASRKEDPYEFLLENGIIPPPWWNPALSRQTYDDPASAKGILTVAAG